MAANSKIEWTDATWNPVTGCTKVSAGCKHCYAERDFHRPYPGRAFTDVRIHPERLDWPLRWRGSKQARAEGRSSRIFVNSMSDLFHEAVPPEFAVEVLAMAGRAPQHIYQVLTKRPERMRNLMLDIVAIGGAQPPKNLWLGVSVEDQKTLEERWEHLRRTPAAVRFLSLEPLLAGVNLRGILPNDEIGGGEFETFPDWIIAGGESGLGARPSHPDYFRSVRDQCQAAGVPFFFKQWGGWIEDVGQVNEAGKDPWPHTWISPDGHQSDGIAAGFIRMRRVGKKNAGRLLDMREWNQMPEVRA